MDPSESTLIRRAEARATREHPALRGDDFAANLAISVRGLNHFYGTGELTKQVLFDNELDLARGEIVIMTGPSGSGKTTLLTLLGALRSVQRGSVRVLDRELCGLAPVQLVEVRRRIGFIFQAHNLFSSLTAKQNVRMALELQPIDTAEMNRRAIEMLTAVGLEKRVDYKPAQLSGGQRQRVAIARALVHEPNLILADEPTAALDKQSGRDVVNLLRKFAKEKLATILIVTHDNRILDVADRIVNMVDGRIVSDVVVSEAAAICDFLRRIPLFSGLTSNKLTEVADKMSSEQFKPGDVILRQGESGDRFYLVRRGEAEVTVEQNGEVRRLAALDEGKYFGERALLTGEPRNATVRAITEVETCSLGKDDFRQVVDVSPTFGEELRRTLFERQS